MPFRSNLLDTLFSLIPASDEEGTAGGTKLRPRSEVKIGGRRGERRNREQSE